MIDDASIGTGVGIDIASNKPLDHRAEHALAGAELLLVILDLVFLASLDESLDVGIGQGKAGIEILERGIILLDVLAVLVHIVDNKLVDNALSHHVAIISTVFAGVDRHKDVGHDATTAIDGALMSQRGVTQRVVEVNAVEAIVLATLRAVEQVFLIGLLVALGIGLLDAATAGSVVTRNSESHHRAVVKPDGALNQSLAESAPPDNYSTIPVLHGSAEDFGSRSRILVDHDDHGQVFIFAITESIGLVARRLEPFGVDDELPTIQELVAHLDGSIEIPSTVVGEVNDDLLHALLGEA